MQFNPETCYINNQYIFNATFNVIDIYIAPLAKEVGLDVLPQLIALTSGRNTTMVSSHALIILTRATVDEIVDTHFQSKIIKVLRDDFVGVLYPWVIQ